MIVSAQSLRISSFFNFFLLYDRFVCLKANFNDSDGGILVGRWTETYPKNTTKPYEWTGSVEILEKYEYGKQSVKYGQCWVFSGLVTTRK